MGFTLLIVNWIFGLVFSIFLMIVFLSFSEIIKSGYLLILNSMIKLQQYHLGDLYTFGSRSNNLFFILQILDIFFINKYFPQKVNPKS